MKLLIAYDGSRCSDAALDDLTHAGLPGKGEAMVISVAEVWLPPPPPSSLEIVELAVPQKGLSVSSGNTWPDQKPSKTLMLWPQKLRRVSGQTSPNGS